MGLIEASAIAAIVLVAIGFIMKAVYHALYDIFCGDDNAKD